METKRWKEIAHLKMEEDFWEYYLAQDGLEFEDDFVIVEYGRNNWAVFPTVQWVNKVRWNGSKIVKRGSRKELIDWWYSLN
jgi:hypothetical protein